jgi:broad specificity phosphatase PhoE
VLDLPLSERGLSQAEELAERLRGFELAALYCGPGESVDQTAERIGRALGLRPRRIDELHNLDQGLWQGLQIEEIKRRNPRLFRQWLDEPRTICPPMGETIEDALERIRSVTRPLLRRHRDETFGLVVPDPIAQIIACFLQRVEDLHLEESCVTGQFEQIEVAPEPRRNGERDG